jgi:hypothetical protein
VWNRTAAIIVKENGRFLVYVNYLPVLKTHQNVS